MRLAKLLLERGERRVVLDYLKLCGEFWDGRELQDWMVVVERGRIPEFGANLVY